MPRFTPDPEALRLGEALAALRRERGLSQAEAGARLDMTSQGWGLYEAGRRSGLFRPDVQRRLTGALDSTPEALALLATAGESHGDADPSPSGVESRGRAFMDSPPSDVVRRLQISDDRLSPWAVSGVVVEYRPGVWPRRGQGCVIETVEGDIRVCVYEGGDAETIKVFGAGSLDRAETVARDRIRRLSAVTARIETS